MGWTFTINEDKQAVIDECIRDCKPHRFIRKALYGNELWTLWLNETTGEKIIVLFLLRKSRKEGWGYKVMDESMGPYYHKCPQAFLLEAKEVNPTWRQRVYDYYSRRNTQLCVDVGDVVVLDNDPRKKFEVVKLYPLLGRKLSDTLTHKKLWRFSRTRITEVLNVCRAVETQH